MTNLTSEQKAQVAELLGWKRCATHGGRFTAADPVFDCRGTCMDLETYAALFLALEALLAYCRERGWKAALEYWPSLWIEDDDETDYRENVFIGEVTIRPDDDPEEDGAVTCNAINSDPVTALSLAVLAAAEQEKAG